MPSLSKIYILSWYLVAHPDAEGTPNAHSSNVTCIAKQSTSFSKQESAKRDAGQGHTKCHQSLPDPNK